MRFERYVNSKDNQTFRDILARLPQFERYVNSKDNQTVPVVCPSNCQFERYVNSKDNQTLLQSFKTQAGLRDM